jgi:hypothetical protein
MGDASIGKRILLLALIVASVVPSPAARAACASPPSVDEAVASNEVVFVGTVVDLSIEGIATVAVESVWKGPRLAVEVQVQTGTAAGIPVLEQRGLDEGVRYLFFPKNASPPFVDDRCTSTQVFTDELERFKPAGALERPGSTEPNSNAAWAFAVAAILIVLLVVQVRRTGRRTRTTRWEHAADEARARDEH